MISCQTRPILTGEVSSGEVLTIVPFPSIRPTHYVHHIIINGEPKINVISHEDMLLCLMMAQDAGSLTRDDINKFLNSLNLQGI